jgi:hypothetical protein
VAFAVHADPRVGGNGKDVGGQAEWTFRISALDTDDRLVADIHSASNVALSRERPEQCSADDDPHNVAPRADGGHGQVARWPLHA